MTHSEFITKYLSNTIDRDGAYWFQCTDLAKVYASQVRWIKPWSFGWSAKTASQSTFPWTKVITPWPWKDLKQGDILIQDSFPWNIYGHVGIVHKADRFWYYLIEQNAVTGTGWGSGNDATRVNYYTRSSRSILRFFRK